MQCKREFSSQDSSGSAALDSTGRCIQLIEVEKNRLKGLQIFQGDESVSDGLALGIGKQAALTARVKVVIDDNTSFVIIRTALPGHPPIRL
ncbi:hypothetical protein C823_007481 [Eubacterium plexicaudatum ASF492]|nr:hypothetical protein C823_007481 [Eubacterium plexicaudatum ASF492]